MPKGMKPAPPQQANLQEMWAKGGTKRQQATSATVAADDAMEVDDAKAGKREELTAPSKSSPERPKSKKRRVVESEDEDAGPSKSPALKPVSSSIKPNPSPSKGKGKAKDLPTTIATKAKKRKIVESDDEHESKPPKSPAKKLFSTKTPAASQSKAAKKEEDEDLKPAVASGNEGGAEEGEGESELDSDEDEGGAVSQNADEALSRLADVDVEGGWKVGDKVPYAALAKTFSAIEATTKRLEKTSILTCFLLLVIQRSAPGAYEPLLQAVYLCVNRLCPDYIGVELGLGESLLIKAITDSTGRSNALVKADLKRDGDLGLVAMNSKNNQKTLFKPKPLTLDFVFKNLKEIAMSSGNASQKKKMAIITKLLAACQDMEAKYIVRSLEGKLRIGNAERSVLVALAHATVLAEREKAGKQWNKEKLTAKLEEGTNTLKSVYSEIPSYDLVIPALLQHGIEKLHDHCKLTPGVPLKPMLAKPTKAIGEVLDRFEDKRFTCEYKYDGERAQVHLLPDGSVNVFSRNSEDMSKKYPDLIDQIPNCIKESAKSFVLDAEAVAIDKDTGKLLPFQELSRRKRKDVKLEDIKVRVCLFGFDLLYLNGEPLLQKTLADRRTLLREHFEEVPLQFKFATSSDAEATEEIQTFLDESMKDGCEGLMVKMLDTDASYYEPSRRSVNWLKLKKDYLAGVGDSLDLVVVGGFYGKGKRTNVYGAFLLAIYNPDDEEFQTICKIGTGFTEEMLQTHWDTLRPLESTTMRGDINPGGAKPDVWFEPKVVWEVLTADLSLSPIYTAARGVGGNDRGISLRFPRFLRIREDKGADDATSPEQVADMYNRQALAQSGPGKKKKGGDADGDFW